MIAGSYFISICFPQISVIISIAPYIPPKKMSFGAEDVAQLVEYLVNVYKALGLTLSTA